MTVETRTIKVDMLARVEGEGALYVRFRGGHVEDVRLTIFEPPRFFEALLRGREPTEAPDITARICGICPVAYQMSAVHALEHAAGVAIDGQIRALRRLLYCGEWIESHVLHIYMLHAPDFLGLPDAVELARTHGDVVRQGLRMKKAGIRSTPASAASIARRRGPGCARWCRNWNGAATRRSPRSNSSPRCRCRTSSRTTNSSRCATPMNTR